MTLLGNGLVRLFLVVILSVVVILIVLNIYLSGKLRELAPVYIDRYSKLSGLALSADEAGLDPLFRIRLNGVKAADPALPQKDLAEIGTLTVDPGIVSSILGRRITIREIVLDSPVVRYDGGSVKKVLDLIKGEEGGGGAAVGIEKIRLNDAQIEFSPDVVITSNDLVIRITKRERGSETGVDVGGDMAVFG
ncbi:MAG: hypothetical protein F9K51_01405, partial [Candidatus Dadabacteria bacterium]